MKKTMKRTMRKWALLAVVSLVLLFGACPDGNKNGNTTSDLITITRVTQVGGARDADGNVTASSTGIRIRFSAPVQTLGLSSVTVTGAAITADRPTGSETSWTIPITPIYTGKAVVTIDRENIEAEPKEVEVYKVGESEQPANWMVRANGEPGSVTTTSLTFVFDKPVALLTIDSFTIEPEGIVTITEIVAEEMNEEWVLDVTVTDGATITITITADGVDPGPKEVEVHHDGLALGDDPWNAPYPLPYLPGDWDDKGVLTPGNVMPHVVINSYAELEKIRNFGQYLKDGNGNVLYEHDGKGNYIFQTNSDGSLVYETDANGVMYKKDGSGNLVYKLDAPDGNQILGEDGQPIPIPLPKRIQLVNPYNSKGGSNSDPLIIQFTEKCDKEEFNGYELNAQGTIINEKIAKWGKDANNDPEIRDPINAILAAIAAQGGNKYTVWDMSACGWDGNYEDAFGDSVPAHYANNNNTYRNNANARNRVVTIYFPRGLKAIGNYMFAGWTGLASLSFKDCSAITTIGDSAFASCTGIRRIDFAGAVNLRTMDNYAFGGATNLQTHGETGVIDLSELTGLTTLGLGAFGNGASGNPGNIIASTWKLILPDCPGIDSNNYTFGTDGGGLRQVWFRGNASHYFSNNSFHASMGGTGNNVASGNTYATAAGYTSGNFTNSNRGLRAHGDSVTDRTDKVLEYFYEESLTPTRMYDGYFYHYEYRNTQGFSALIPVKNGQDIYRGQTTMTINGPPVPNAPGGTVDVFSEKNNAAQYKIGTMTGGIITLTTPNANNRETLRGTPSTGDHPGMKITGDPRNYYTGKTSDGSVNTSSAKGWVRSTSGTVDGFVERTTLTGPGAASAATSHSSVTHWYWWPWIGNNTNNYNRSANSAAKATIVKSMFYQDGGQWKEIKRKGEDIHTRIYSFYNKAYHLDQHEMMWVWLDKDITLFRVSRAGADGGQKEINYAGPAVGQSQNLYETAPNNVFSTVYRGKAVGVVHSTLNMSLKAGWNQLVTTTRFSDGEDDEWGYRCSWKIVRVWHGYMGPFSVFNTNNPNPMSDEPPDFSRNDGFAYNTYPKSDSITGDFANYSSAGKKRQYVDDPGKKFIPWTQVQ